MRRGSGSSSFIMTKPAFRHAGFFYLRTPLLPWDALESLVDIRGVTADPFVRDALSNASLALLDQLRKPTADTDFALLKYFIRMTARPTPYGLMAGCTFGTIESQTNMTLAPRSEYRRHVKLDCGVLASSCERAIADAEERRRFAYRLNPTLYFDGARWRYIDYVMNGEYRRYQLSTLRPGSGLSVIFEQSSWPLTFAQCAGALTESLAVDTPSAEAFIDQLIDNRILLPEVEPSVTGSAPECHPERELCHPERESKDLSSLHIDLYKPALTATVAESTISELSRAIDCLHRIIRTPADAMSAFARRYEDRYGDVAVPLLEALDANAASASATSSTPIPTSHIWS